MTLEDYKIIRKTGLELAYKILKFRKNDQDEIINAGDKLGFWNGKSMVFDYKSESDILMDYMIYEKDSNGNRLINDFYNSDHQLNEMESAILQGQVNYHSSLFQVKVIDKTKSELEIVDLLNNEYSSYKLLDIGLSNSANIGLLIYTRLIPIEKKHITSGVSFGFNSSKKEKILNDITAERFAKGRKLNSQDLFILIHYKCKLYGLNINKKEIL